MAPRLLSELPLVRCVSRELTDHWSQDSAHAREKWISACLPAPDQPSPCLLRISVYQFQPPQHPTTAVWSNLYASLSVRVQQFSSLEWRAKQYGRQTWAHWKWELKRSTCRVCLCWELNTDLTLPRPLLNPYSTPTPNLLWTLAC